MCTGTEFAWGITTLQSSFPVIFLDGMLLVSLTILPGTLLSIICPVCSDVTPWHRITRFLACDSLRCWCMSVTLSHMCPHFTHALGHTVLCRSGWSVKSHLALVPVYLILRIRPFKTVPRFCVQKLIESYACAKTKHNLEKKHKLSVRLTDSTISLNKQSYWCFNTWISRIAE